jgi:hypothetical protein
VDQVAKVQFARRVAALDLDGALIIGVVEFLAAYARLRCAVAVPRRIGGGAVPQLAAGLLAFHLQIGVAVRPSAIGVGVLAGHIHTRLLRTWPTRHCHVRVWPHNG